MGKTNDREVVVTGVGPVTAIGVGTTALWASMGQERSKVEPRSIPVDIGRNIELPMSSMPNRSHVPGLDKHLDYLAGQECEGYRDVGYALLGIELAIEDAALQYDREQNSIGVIQAFEAPGAECTVGRLFQMLTTPLPTDGPPPVYDMLSPFFYNMQPFLYVHLVSKAFGFRGFSTGIHNACSSGAFAIEVAAQQIRDGRAEVMIVTGGEAFDTGVRLEWFRRLDLYAPDHRMRPFDKAATGFFVGEGGAAIVLESASHAAKRGAEVYAKYLGGAFAHQGWKQVIPDVRASRLRDVILEALDKTGVGVGDLDLIVPHGAATQLSDGYEASCLAQALQGKREHAVATAFKPYVGHMLAASGIIDTVCMLLAMKHQTIPATLHTAPDDVQLPVPLVTSRLQCPVKTALKLSTGFTGHDAALVFQAD